MTDDNYVKTGYGMFESPWKPIESAPKDGSEIVVCEAGTRNIEFVRYYNGAWVDRTYDGFSPATHWMPSPPPPETTK